MSTCTDPSCRMLAAQYLRKQCKQLLSQFAGIRQATDIEYIHRARVASRRLRAALRIFGDCLPQKPLKRWRKHVRQITAGLGAARDLDVQRGYLVEVLSQLEEPAHYPGIARLLVRADVQRDRVQRSVLAALHCLEESRVLQQMRKALKSISQQSDEDNLLQTPACYQMAEHHVGECLRDMLSLEDSLDDPEDSQQHHAMRIAAKQLRYTMEICRPVYGNRSDATIDAVKRLQTLLGDVHDCDVWIGQLPCLLEEERASIVKRYGHAGPSDRLKPGIDYLIDREQRRRRERFGELTCFWRQQVQRGTWAQLGKLLRYPSASSEEKPEEATAGKPIEQPVSPESAEGNSHPATPSAMSASQTDTSTNGNSSVPPCSTRVS